LLHVEWIYNVAFSNEWQH